MAIADKTNMRALEPTVYLSNEQAYLAGMFLKAQERAYILVWLNAPGLHPYGPVYHEYTHFVLHRTGQWLPVWLDEGLAEYFQTTEIGNDEVLIGKAEAGNINHLEQNPLLPLPTLFTVDQHSPYYHEDNKISIFYSESWALTHYLRMKDSRENTNHLADYVALVNSGTDPVTAATKAFGDLDQLRTELRKYIVNAEYGYVHLPGVTDVDPSSFAVRGLSQDEIGIARADFLAHDGRDDEAKALLEGLLAEHPDNVRALEIMGLLTLHEHKLDEAHQWCERAVKADPESFIGQTCFALSSMHGALPKPAEQARVEESLRTAIKINPSFAPAYAGLGEFLSFKGEYDEALTAVRKAVQLDPGQVVFRIDEANVLLQMKRVKEGIDVLEFSLKTAHSPEEIALVETVLESAKQYEAARAKSQGQPPAFVLHGMGAAGGAQSAAATTPPHAIYSPQPEYTEEARQAKHDGVCIVSLIVGVDGKPSNIVVIKKLGMGLDEKAVEAVQKWEFEPARRYGHPVPMRLNINLTFKVFGTSTTDVLQLSERAKEGDPAAEFELANIFLEGKGVPKDESQGLALLQRAAQGGLPQAQFQMGERIYGDGNSPDAYVDAYVWYSLAEHGAVEHSDERIAKLEGQMTPEQLEEARKRVAEWESRPGK